MEGVKRISLSDADIRRLLSLSHDPHPRDFERFIPWLFMQFGIGNVRVKRLSQADYQPVEVARSIQKKSKKPQSTKNISVVGSQADFGKKESIASTKATDFKLDLSSVQFSEDDVIISAYYDSNGALVEIAFVNCPVPVPTELFMVINLCLPFNTQLTRTTWKGPRLTSTLIHEISKILPGSELTDLIFDGCYVAQGNYYLLLDQATKLKYLSLSNCKINDVVCGMIAERIQRNGPAAGNLLVLNLSSNHITDVGAEALGRSLKTNRRLLYLNLSNNEITSVGAAHILLSLTRFPLNPDENKEMQLRKLNAAKDKLAASCNKCLKDVTNVYVEHRQDVKENKTKLKKKTKSVHSHFENLDVEAKVSATIVEDVYLATITEAKKGFWFSLGNFTLCGLNLAYNQLDLTTVSMIADVVSYQYREDKGFKTGLLRVVIEGNPLPITCNEYDFISKYIELAISKAIPEPPSSHTTFTSKMMKSKTSRSEQRVKTN